MIRTGIHIFFAALLLFGCQSGVENELENRLQESENSGKAANKEIDDLKTQIKVLTRELEDANFNNDNLKIRINETDEWAGYVVKRIGPCVWVGGIFEKPVPHEIIRKGSPGELIQKLNENFKTEKSPEAKLLKVEGGTAFIKITDDEKLTQSMGTSGAANYLNSITYTLWSIKGIRCVDIDFKGGDHAFPTKNCIGSEF